DPDPDADDWLARYEAWGKQRCFDLEPDFPIALAAYRQALTEAKACPDQPANGDLLGFKAKYRFPALHRAWDWLAGMMLRRVRNQSPVTMKEFDDLAAWFERNSDRMPFNACVDLGNGQRVDRTNLYCGIQKGVTDVHVGELVESLRRLREVMRDA